MIEFNNDIASHGKIFLKILNDDNTSSEMAVRNKVVLSGRVGIARSLANHFNGNFPFYATRVLFGNNGTIGGTPRFVEDSRNGLFGPVLLTKPVISLLDEDFPSMVTFTTTVLNTELIGVGLNEMALEMANGDLFSMATFGDINKTSTMALVWQWRISFV